jgi:hypothetical protein
MDASLGCGSGVRILYRGEWFDPLVGPGSLSEREFETLVFQQAEHLFPNFVMVKYRLDVVADEGPRRPDFALIHRNYRVWWVVEVELLHHSLHSHVLPQVIAFSTGSYGPALAEYLAGASVELDVRSVSEMIKGSPPRVLVIANAYSEEWERNLVPYGAELVTVEVFRSSRNRHVFRCRGAELEGAPDVLTLCRRDRLLPTLLIVESPAALMELPGARVTIYFDGTPSEWTRISASDRVWLSPVIRSPFDDTIRSVELVKDGSGRLSFRRTAKGGRS